MSVYVSGRTSQIFQALAVGEDWNRAEMYDLVFCAESRHCRRVRGA